MPRAALLAEFATAARFGLVGLAATVVHMAFAWHLVAHEGLRPLAANAIAFAVAFAISFTGHHVWTFRRSTHAGRALLRFFAVSATAFLASNVLLAALVRSARLADTAAVALAAAAIPIVTYVLARIWAFDRR